MPDTKSPISILAETAGTLWKLVAQPGEMQVKDATLLIIESMKMEIPLEAQSAGYIESYCVAEGEIVEEGQVLGSFIPVA
ncbi:acyl-CoA carboxylase biotin carboxyl carrier protein subunit [Cupriavidus sp. CuC1]|uniref:acetyl-CoA carboxylase biotin carboxyl carrier protein subunit n=1 Tax=Cupriavidus sp. CuC1 TaxID=3373131 RepID=UPI0037D6E9E5